VAAVTVEQLEAVERTFLVLLGVGVVATFVGLTGMVAPQVVWAWRDLSRARRDRTGGIHQVNPQAWDLVDLANSVEPVRGIRDGQQ
jgi:hypothetical protein